MSETGMEGRVKGQTSNKRHIYITRHHINNFVVRTTVVVEPAKGGKKKTRKERFNGH